MKKFIIHTSYDFGGAECSLIDILSNISNKEQYILILAPNIKLCSRIEKIGGYSIHKLHFPILRKKNLWYLWLPLVIKILVMTIQLKKVCNTEETRTIYCNTHQALFYLPRLLYRNTRVVTICRDNINTALERKLISINSTLTLAVSRHILRQLPPTKSRLFYNAIDCTHLESVKVSNDLSKTIRIANVGNILRWKNQIDFIIIASEILKYTESVHFYIIGHNTDKLYEGLLRTRIQELGIADHITFTGYLSNPKQLYANMDILVHTAGYEPFGRVVIEFMVLGKTVLAYNNGGPSEIINHNKNGFLIPYKDTRLMTDCLLEVIANPSLRKTIGHSASVDIKAVNHISKYVYLLETYINNNHP